MRPFTKGIEKRTIIFFAAFVLLFTILFVRLGYLSTSPGLMATAQNQSKYTLTVEERRGYIYDCNLLPMVNRTDKLLYAVLPTSTNMQPVLDAVSQERRESVLELLQLAKPFLLQTDQKIQADNVTPFYQSQRYEQYQLAPHIIGYLDSEGNGVTGIEKGYNAFALIYRPGAQTACEDLARAIAYIHEHADELQVDITDYSLWGGSAGGRMAAWLGSYGTAAFGEQVYPRPAAVIIQYTGLSEVSGNEPPTYSCVGTSDGIASYKVMESRINRIRSNGTDAEIEIFKGLPHGFGLGEGTIAEGWINNAVEFWERQIKED